MVPDLWNLFHIALHVCVQTARVETFMLSRSGPVFLQIWVKTGEKSSRSGADLVGSWSNLGLPGTKLGGINAI